MAELCDQLNDRAAFASVASERETLRSHGGGCHQKIGVAVLPRPYGVVHALRGLTEAGVVLHEWRLDNSVAWTKAKSRAHVFPAAAADNSWFERRDVAPARDLAREPGLFVARAEALPASAAPNDAQLVWTAGVRSWARFVWPNVAFGSAVARMGVASREPRHLEQLAPGVTLTKLTHAGRGRKGRSGDLRARAQNHGPDLKNKTHFYWMSGTSFTRARELYPREIAAGFHASGPGSTHEFLCAQPGLRHPPKVFIGLEQFLSET